MHLYVLLLSAAALLLLVATLASGQDIADVLTQLASLKAEGLLTADEFSAAKSRVLLGAQGGSGAAAAGARRELGAEAAAAAAAGLFALDSVSRVLSLTRPQIMLWLLGALPCVAFGAALLAEEVPAGLGAVVGGWVAKVRADPMDVALHDSGQWAIRALVGCLTITPLKNTTRAFWLHPLRQTFGLLAFGYSAIHGALYVISPDHLAVGGDGGSNPADVYASLEKDLRRRPYILFGIVGTSIMFLLAVTSYNAARVKMGRWWGRLHKLTYVTAIVAGIHVFHYQYLRPALSITGAYFYPAVLGLLLAYRVVTAMTPKKAKPKAA